jgi:hypothetical protein
VTRRSRQQAVPSGLLERLMATVRPEFRGDMFVPTVGDLIFSGPACAVPGCARACYQRSSGLCRAHMDRYRWQGSVGHLDLAVFVTTTSPHVRGWGPLAGCLVAGCRRGRAVRGLCASHGRTWQQAGRPELAGWAATATTEGMATSPTCGLPLCELWVEAETQPFCRSHMTRWRDFVRRTGQHDPEAFIDHCRMRGVERFDLRALPPQLKLELQYALQCLHDERRATLRPQDSRLVVRFLLHSGVESLLNLPLDVWEAKFRAFVPSGRLQSYPSSRRLLRYAWQRVDNLASGQGWEAEYPRDIWDLRRLGINGRPRWLRFDRIPQPWLRVLAKRWLRYRLSNGTSAAHVGRYLVGLQSLARSGDMLAAWRHETNRLSS